MKKQFLFCLAAALFTVSVEAAVDNSPAYLVGRGMADVTGPAVGMQMWGFGRTDQITEGIHIRQRSRAFVIAQADDPQRRLAFVSADLGSIEHHMTLEVVQRLQQHFGDTYSLDNVIISATHTHAGPGGYWHSRNDTGMDGGFYPEHFEAIIAGITRSIVQAHNDLQPGDILINTGKVTNAGVNRSLSAYMENPPAERERYPDNTPTEMTLLKFVDESGPIGMLNWYALHPTAMNFYNRLISGDHKGYASLITEQTMGTNYQSEGDFVAAFAQADPGDVTPNTNLDNTGPGDTDVDTTRIMGERQLEIARLLFDNAEEVLRGPIDTRRVYVDLSDYQVQDRYTGMGTQTTCPSAYGYSFAGGSTEDGGGHFLFKEGMRDQSYFLDLLIRFVTGAPQWTESVKACQSPKPILFETGSGNPPLQSQIRPVTLARIGQLVILALPAEVTTMAGRRLRDSVMAELGDWARHIVIAGYSNDYAGYVTTGEEYLLQQYEAAHTLHGRWTLAAYQQVASELASAMESGSTITTETVYDDWRGKTAELPLPEGGTPGAGIKYGDALPLKKTQYAPGETVTVEFWSSNPTDHYRTENNYLLVEYQTPSGWQTVADDSDWNTQVRWRSEDDALIAQLSWQIPANSPAGNYRFTHLGQDPTGKEFRGVSQAFDVWE
jgi:neutral ceramidase